jgi:hypothetical protein
MEERGELPKRPSMAKKTGCGNSTEEGELRLVLQSLWVALSGGVLSLLSGRRSNGQVRLSFFRRPLFLLVLNR